LLRILTESAGNKSKHIDENPSYICSHSSTYRTHNMTTTQFLQQIRDLIARDDLADALQQLRLLLDSSPKLDEAILQSARFQDIRKQIRLGTVSNTESNLTQNQIRAGLLDLLREIEEGIKGTRSQDIDRVTSSHPVNILREEMEHAISIVNSKNVLVGSSITAGGNVEIGDRTIHTESPTSRRLRLFLFVFVPLLAIGAALLWQRLQKMKTPLLITVALDNRTPNRELPFEGGTVTLQYGDKSETLAIQKEADFKGIPANFSDEPILLRFEANGFFTVDTTFIGSAKRLTLPIRRDNSLACIAGRVKDAQGYPLEAATVRVLDISDITKADGSFKINIPPDKQRKQQRVEVFLRGYKPWDYTFPVSEKEEIPVILQSK